MHVAHVLEAGDEMHVGYMHRDGTYVEVKVMTGVEDSLVVVPSDESVQVVGGHQCIALRAT